MNIFMYIMLLSCFSLPIYNIHLMFINEKSVIYPKSSYNLLNM